MEYTLRLFITDEFGSHDVRTYSTMAENIDKAYEKNYEPVLRWSN